MNQEPNSEAAETAQITDSPAVDPSTACSPSSDTPEADKASFMHACGPVVLRETACKLERERNEWREKAEHRSIFVTTTGDTLNSVLMAIRAYRDAKGRYHTQKACDRLLAFLPENDQRDAPI